MPERPAPASTNCYTWSSLNLVEQKLKLNAAAAIAIQTKKIVGPGSEFPRNLIAGLVEGVVEVAASAILQGQGVLGGRLQTAAHHLLDLPPLRFGEAQLMPRV